jgi:hypothetical protein
MIWYEKGKNRKELKPMTMEDLGFKDVGPVQLSQEHVAMVEAYSKGEDETMAVEMIKNA